eukprot:5667684-Alexandrium_andersonii.AAC.1
MSLAATDFRALKRVVHSAKLRSGVPEWEAPAELWRMLLDFQWVLRRQRVGVGAPAGFQFPSGVF